MLGLMLGLGGNSHFCFFFFNLVEKIIMISNSDKYSQPTLQLHQGTMLATKRWQTGYAASLDWGQMSDCQTTSATVLCLLADDLDETRNPSPMFFFSDRMTYSEVCTPAVTWRAIGCSKRTCWDKLIYYDVGFSFFLPKKLLHHHWFGPNTIRGSLIKKHNKRQFGPNTIRGSLAQSQ